MNRLIPSLEIDIKPAAGAAAHKARILNNGRHHGKMPEYGLYGPLRLQQA